MQLTAAGVLREGSELPRLFCNQVTHPGFRCRTCVRIQPHPSKPVHQGVKPEACLDEDLSSI